MAGHFHPALDAELAAVALDAQHPLASLSVLALRQGAVVYEGQWGHRYIDNAQPERSLKADADTLYRVASLSKLVTTLGVMRLVEQGALDLDRDVGDYLGYPLRNPHFPTIPISLRMMLSHTSSLRDDAGYHWDAASGVHLRDVLTAGARHHGDGRMWARHAAPGQYFSYVNLPWGVVGSVMEAVTQERFDRLMRRLVLDPLGLTGGFEPAEFPAAELKQLATLYRKRAVVAGREVWQPQGPWVAQVDDYTQAAPMPRARADYVPGSNGTLFGPQGNCRLSARSVGTVLQMLLNMGLHRGTAFLRSTKVQGMLAPQWQSNGASGSASNGETLGGMMQAWGLGLQQYLDRGSARQADRLVAGGGYTGWGHFGDAWGLRALMVFNPSRRDGMVFLTGGPGFDPALTPGHYSAMYLYEERILTALHRHLLR